MNFIQLTYYKREKNYGPGGAGDTKKKFYLATNHIIRITDYEHSTKISLSTGSDIEVAEHITEVAELIKNAMPLHLELSVNRFNPDK